MVTTRLALAVALLFGGSAPALARAHEPATAGGAAPGEATRTPSPAAETPTPALAPPARRPPPPCLTDVVLEPEHAFVGQQVLYRLRILRREDVASVRWIEPLSFPSFRAEWLPGRSPDPRIAGIGTARLVFEERRALFPARPGTLAIPGATLGCSAGEAGHEQAAAVPAAQLAVDPLPSAGRPADFSGLVGSVTVRMLASPQRVVLGGTFTLAVSITGEANVWAAEAPLDPAALPGVDAYPRRPELTLEPGERLSARRSFVWQLVPRRSGRIAVPAARVSWFDPEAGRYAVAEAPGVSVEVMPPAAPAGGSGAPPAARGTETAAADGGAPRSHGAVAATAAALGALAALLALALAALRRRRAPRRAAAGALAEADAAAARGDAAGSARALAAALRAALETRLPGARGLAPEEIAARGDGPVRDAAALLASLDRARFAPPGSAAPPEAARIRAVLRRL